MRISPPAANPGGGEDRLLFATNAGMFDPALKPVGLCGYTIRADASDEWARASLF